MFFNVTENTDYRKTAEDRQLRGVLLDFIGSEKNVGILREVFLANKDYLLEAPKGGLGQHGYMFLAFVKGNDDLKEKKQDAKYGNSKGFPQFENIALKSRNDPDVHNLCNAIIKAASNKTIKSSVMEHLGAKALTDFESIRDEICRIVKGADICELKTDIQLRISETEAVKSK